MSDVRYDASLQVFVADPDAYLSARNAEDRARKLQWAADDIKRLGPAGFREEGRWVDRVLPVRDGAIEEDKLVDALAELLKEYQTGLQSAAAAGTDLSKFGLDPASVQLGLMQTEADTRYYYSEGRLRWCNQRWEVCANDDMGIARKRWTFPVEIDAPADGTAPARSITTKVMISIRHPARHPERSDAGIRP